MYFAELSDFSINESYAYISRTGLPKSEIDKHLYYGKRTESKITNYGQWTLLENYYFVFKTLCSEIIQLRSSLIDNMFIERPGLTQ